MGAATLLLTHTIETLGQMSCNPSIGGIGKGHLVKEIDALGGAMAAATDEAGIQFRILNGSKGPAVRATRAQADRVLYKAAIRRRLENQPNLWLFQGACDDLIVEGDRVAGVVTQVGVRFACTCRGADGGHLPGREDPRRAAKPRRRPRGDPPAMTLSARLKELKLPQGRLKTGTPPRLDGRTIDFSQARRSSPATAPADGCDPRSTCRCSASWATRRSIRARCPCWITHTNARTHEIIRSGFDRSPMFTGVIDGVGPRYCPSIEDKVNRFADKDSHQIFLEPEGLTTHEVYPNGISTSLPFDVQLDAVRSIAGLENAHILRPGYAIEYDYFDPRALEAQLRDARDRAACSSPARSTARPATKRRRRKACSPASMRRWRSRGDAPWVPSRDQAYLGVLVDDLVTKGVTEPYRMFTSRAEFRLQLREDNADARLTERGPAARAGLDARWAAFERKRDAVSRETERLASTRVGPAEAHEGRPALDPRLLAARSAASAGRRFRHGVGAGMREAPGVSRETLRARAGPPAGRSGDRTDRDRDALRGLHRQAARAGRARRERREHAPSRIDWTTPRSAPCRSRRARCCARHRPRDDRACASRLPGVTPAAISLLLVHLKKQRRIVGGQRRRGRFASSA